MCLGQFSIVLFNKHIINANYLYIPKAKAPIYIHNIGKYYISQIDAWDEHVKGLFLFMWKY